MDAWVKQRARNSDMPSPDRSWNVAVSAKKVRYNGLAQRLEPHLRVLEDNGVDLVDDTAIASMAPGQVRDAALAIVAERVLRAKVFPTKDPSMRRLFTTPMGSWTSRGADDALGIIEKYLAASTDNQRKLAEADTDQFHLFLWLDSDTDGAVAATFTALEAHDGQLIDLPSRPPELPDPITDLWVIHRATGRGWMYSFAAGWRPVELGLGSEG